MTNNDTVKIRDVLARTNRDNIHLGEDLLITDKIEETALFEGPRILKDHLFYINVEGELLLSVNHETVRFGANDIAYIPSESIIRQVDFDKVHGYAVMMSQTFVKSLQFDFLQTAYANVSTRHYLKVTIPDDERRSLRPFYELMESVYLKPYKLRNSEILCIMSSFLFRLTGIMERHGNMNIVVGSRSNATYFRMFMQLLYENYREQRSLTFYADRMCLSTRYLASIIKRESGKTPTEWIDTMVVRDALTLLKKPRSSVKEVALYLNFTSQSAFGKYIKVHTGHSPSYFQEQR